MIKRYIVCAFLNLLTIALFAQITFMRAYNTPAPSGPTEESDAYSVQQTSDGGYILAGWSQGFWGYRKHEFYLIRTNANGDTLWSKRYGGDEMEEATYVSQTTNGGFIATGYSRGFGTTSSLTEIYVVKTDNNGDTVWTRTYGTGKAQYEGGMAVKQTTDGGFILTGTMGNNGYDVALIKLNANGDTSWTKTYGGNSSDGGWTVQQTTDGGYIVAGSTSSYGAGGTDLYVIKTNSSGDTLWTKTYGGSSNENGEYGTGPTIQQTTDGGYIMLGTTYSFGAGKMDMYLVRINSSGDTLWTRAYGGTEDEEGSSMDITSDGGFILAGFTKSFGAGGRDVYLIKTDSKGDTLWTKTYGDSDYDKGRAIEQTADGGYVISGVTWSYTSNWQDMYLIKTNANGLIDECAGKVGSTNTQVNKTNTIVSSGGIIGSGCVISGTQTIVQSVAPEDSVVCQLLTPIASFKADDTSICVGDCINFTDLSSGSPTSWKWSFSGAVIATSTIQNPTNICYNTAGKFDVTLIVSNANGSDTDTIIQYINVDTIMNATITSTVVPYCINDASVTLKATDGGGKWVGKGITDTTAGTFSPSVAGGGTHTITYTISGSCGDTDSISITIDTIISAKIYSDTFCPADSPDTVKADNPNKGTWSGNGITNTSLGIFDPSKVSVGTYTISYTTINGKCSSTNTAIITVTNAADASITNTGPYCFYDNTNKTLQAATAGGTWTGKGITNALSGTFNPEKAGAGTHTISYTIGGGCGASSTTTIEIDTTLDASFITQQPYCNLAPPDTFQADNPGGVWSGQGITNTVLGIFNPAIATEGVHTIMYVTTNRTCSDTSIENITVSSLLSAAITPILPLCVSNPIITLSAATAGGVWSGKGITDNSLGTFNPTTAGIGTDTIVYSIDKLCGDTDTFAIQIVAIPKIKITTTNVSCPNKCDGQGIAEVAGNNPFTYEWKDNGQVDSIATDLCSGDYLLIVTDNNGCKDSSNIIINDTNKIKADFTIDPLPVSNSDPHVFFTDNSQGNIGQWNWIFYNQDELTELGNSTGPITEFIFPSEYGSYPVKLIVKDTLYNCLDSIIKIALVEGEYVIYVPNAFTPNNDDINDIFLPIGLGINPDNFKLYIFDRWGELIFETDVKEQGWNGTANGGSVIVPDGVYIWKLLAEEETLERIQHTYIGHVTVIK